MGFELTSKDYVEYLKKAYVKIHESGDYITELDAVTGRFYDEMYVAADDGSRVDRPFILERD